MKLKIRRLSFHILVLLFKFLALEIENGLIVNKETHSITVEGICDESELLELAEKKLEY